MFLVLFFLFQFLPCFSANSTENRQNLYDLIDDDTKSIVHGLEKEVRAGDNIAKKAFDLYRSIILGCDSEYKDDVQAQAKLIQSDLAYMREGTFVLYEFVISDVLKKIERTESFYISKPENHK